MRRILTKNDIDNTNIDGARDHNFNAGRRSGIVKGALNQGNFFASSSNTIVLDSCELRLCGHRVVIDSAEYFTFYNKPSVPIRYSLVAQIIVDNNSDVSFDLHAQTSSTALVQDNLDASGSGTFELEIGRFTQLTDGTVTDVVRTADLITGGAGGGDSEYIRIGTVTTNKISPELDADVDIENTINPTDNKPQTNFTFNLPTAVGTVVSVNGEEKTAINTDLTPTANSSNLITSGGVHDYPAVTFAESERQKSKNLFNYEDIMSKPGLTTDNNGTFYIDTTGYYVIQQLNIPFELNKTYTMSCNVVSITGGNNPTFEFAVKYKDGEWAGYGSNIITGAGIVSASFTPTKEVDLFELRFIRQNPEGQELQATINKLQLEEGSVATDYQPYNGAIIHEKKLNEIVNGKYPIDINACTTYDQVYNLLQNATYGQCGIGVNHTNAIKSLLPTFPTNASYVDCVANVIKNKYTASVSTYAIRFTGCPFGLNQPIYYCDVFYDGENTIVTGWYKPIAIKLIYDMSSSDSNINWGKTTGIKASAQVDGVLTITPPVALKTSSKYRVYVNWGGDMNIFTASVNHSGIIISGCSATWAYLLYAEQLQMCEFQYLSNTNQLQLRFRSLSPSGTFLEIQTSEYVYITKIEEIY